MTQPRVHAPSASAPAVPESCRRLGRDLAVGDLLVAWDRRVTSIEEYPSSSPLHAAQGGPLDHGTRIAHCGEGWRVTVCPLASLEVVA